MKKNNFLPGFFMGLLTTLVVAVAAMGLYFTQGAQNKIAIGTQAAVKNDGVSNDTKKDSKDKETSVTTNTIMSKINLLESIIDTYYIDAVDSEQLADGIYKGLLQSLNDPYSCYYTAKEYNQLMESSNGIYCGIGAVVSQNAKTKVITIVKPYENGPAYIAGVRPNDIIYKVNGEDVTGEDLSDVVSRMRGEPKTKVTLTVVREGEIKPLDFEITRDKIEVPTVEYKMLEDKIGYVIVSEFDKVTADQYRKAISDLEEQGMQSLIVDLRNNPGGRYDTVCNMLDRMLPKGLIVYQEDKSGKRAEECSTNKEKFTKPLVVLINENSASASEIFAGAIQDYKAGTLIGTTSFGKGIVQSIIPLTDGTAVKVTVSKYYTPNGRNIHGTGIEPDIKVELAPEVEGQIVIDYQDDAQLQKAVEVLKDKMK